MISTSQDWKDYSNEIGTFHIKAVLDNGTQMTLTDADFMQGSVSITDSISGMSAFTVGEVITNSFKGTLNNYEGKFNGYRFNGARLSVQFGIIYEDESEEWIDRGVYNIEKPTSFGSTIEIIGYDDMDLFNKEFDSIVYAGKDLYDNATNTTTMGAWLDKNGATIVGQGYAHSDYFEVDGSTIYETNALSGYVIFYSSNKTYIDYGTIDNGVVTSSINASYAIINISQNENFRKSCYFRAIEGDTASTLPEHFPADMFVEKLCKDCGVPHNAFTWALGSMDATPSKLAINESTTYKQVLSWVLQSAGGYARINPQGVLECRPFKIGEWIDIDSLDGGTISPWSAGDNADGGSIEPWTNVSVIDGGWANGGYTLTNIKTLNLAFEDIIITGVRAYVYNTIDAYEYYQVGDDGYVIAVQNNPLVYDVNESGYAIATRVASRIQGLSILPFDATIYGDPSIEAGDIVVLTDYLGHRHVSMITSLTYSINKVERIECNAETPKENENSIISTTGIAADSTSATLAKFGDYIVERGTEGIWTYEKWHSGKSVCWGTLVQEVTSWNQDGSLYTAATAVRAMYPSELFKERPMLFVTADGTTADGYGFSIFGVRLSLGATYAQTPYMTVFRSSNGTAQKIPIYIMAIGTWK